VQKLHLMRIPEYLFHLFPTQWFSRRLRAVHSAIAANRFAGQMGSPSVFVVQSVWFFLCFFVVDGEVEGEMPKS
jgi:hypothetical protein